ncbi:MAG TPA: purine-nucleoside phosphorylase [Ktedonobacter sp.]|nr:purine-nucleoside phosphorylase [Ktedonobacter sp.]
MLYDDVMEATNAIRARTQLRPHIALILGSGLGALADEIEQAVTIPYEDIPHFAHSTVAGHAGRLVIGMLEGVAVVAMQGRFHFYEGYTQQVITFPVRVMHMLGAETLFVSNAAGGVNPAYHPGDFMLLRDHISLPGLSGANPLMGPNDERFGERFPPLAKAYDPVLRNHARTVASTQPATLHEGVYVMVSGPSFETGAELRFLHTVGADAVGMSTVPEVIVARHMGMRVLGISLITNEATGSEAEDVKHEDVLAVGSAASQQFIQLVRGILRATSF